MQENKPKMTVKVGLYPSLFKVQSAGLNATKGETASVPTKAGGQYSYTYASLEDVWNVLRGPLSDAKLVVVQQPQRDVLVTTVAHIESGETITSEVPLITAEESRNHMQDLGGAITYARRYALCSMFNIITNDDDAGSTTKDAPTRQAGSVISDKQTDLIKDLLVKKGYAVPAIEDRVSKIKTGAEASALIKKLLEAGNEAN